MYYLRKKLCLLLSLGCAAAGSSFSATACEETDSVITCAESLEIGAADLGLLQQRHQIVSPQSVLDRGEESELDPLRNSLDESWKDMSNQMSSYAKKTKFELRTGQKPFPVSSLDEIVKAAKGTPHLIPSGAGWSWCVKHEDANMPLMTLQGWNGVIGLADNRTVHVKTGTKMKDLREYLKSRGRSLADHPQFDEVTVGGAIRSAGHGSSRTTAFIDTVAHIRGVELVTGRLVEVSKGEPDFWPTIFNDNIVILDAGIETIENIEVCVMQRIVHLVPGSLHFERLFLDSPFWGAQVRARGEVTVWTALPMSAATAECAKLQRTEIGSASDDRAEALARWLGAKISFTKRQLLGDSMRLVPELDFLHNLITCKVPYFNFELFTYDSYNMSHAMLALGDFHAQFGGRSEVRAHSRHGKLLVTGFDAVSFNQHRVWDNEFIDNYLAVLHDQLGVKRATLHHGKYTSFDMSPIEYISRLEFWGSLQ